MTALIVVEQPLFLHITNSASWKLENSLNPHYRTASTEKIKKTWRLHAESKGFSRAAAGKQQRLQNKQTNAPGKSYRNKGSGDGGDDEKIPEEVFERMISRIVVSVGFPLVTGIVLLKIFDALSEQHLLEIPLWLPVLTTFITFSASTLGIAYGTLSTSLEPERKGSLLGFEEAQKNWVEMWKEDEESK